MLLWKKHRISLYFYFVTIISGSAFAEKAQWELGIGLAAMDIPFIRVHPRVKRMFFHYLIFYIAQKI